MSALLLPAAALCAGAALALLLPVRAGALAPALPPPAGSVPGPVQAEHSRLLLLVPLTALVAGPVLLGPLLGVPAGLVVAGLLLRRVRGRAAVHAREAERRSTADLPALVGLVATSLAGGADPGRALGLAVDALPGPGAERLRAATRRLDLGAEPGLVWAQLARDPSLGPLGQAFRRAHDAGASVSDAVDRLADQLAADARASAEDAARAVGVKAAVPLGLLLLPSFVLLGIVPVAAGMLAGVLG
ncbi:type II secretion system F family protein [Nocardioides bruguierae]|uniref:Type II secretion system F family protein n=1 Tax=Nocardioides bruguierae TaxID=2945102 RepID=A0A9X2D7T3_9ACTN|nr:type II secretion system F family protein [Nocardioides bruguierae]MCM0620746.1 type II secretion system F family protein [Nocardioides bruguierae]